MAKINFSDMVESAKEGFAIAVAKVIEERIMANFVGNANFVSGIAKLVVSSFVPSSGLLKYLKVAMVVDAGEDLAYSLLGGFFGRGEEVNVI